MKRFFYAAALALLASLPVQADAQTISFYIAGKVTFIEGTYLPGQIPFRIDAGDSNCPAGSTILWTAQGADATAQAQNAQAILAMLMTAQVSGHTIGVAGYTAGSNGQCTANFVYLN